MISIDWTDEREYLERYFRLWMGHLGGTWKDRWKERERYSWQVPGKLRHILRRRFLSKEPMPKWI